MFKRICSAVLALVLLTLCTACNEDSAPITVTAPLDVAVESNSVTYFTCKDYLSTQDYILTEYAVLESAVNDVQNGTIDYILLCNEDVSADFLNLAQLKLKENIACSLNYHCITTKDSAMLAESVNSAIDELKNDGTFQKIKENTFLNSSYDFPDSSNSESAIRVLCIPVFDNKLYFDDKGEIAGSELLYINAICNKLGVKAELIPCSDEIEMFEALNNGDGDIIISCMTYTQERSENYLFTDAYATATFGLYERL